MIDARNYYAVEEKLRDGTEVIIRAVRPDDADRLVNAFRQLDPQSVYARFFGYRKEPTAVELARLDTLDFVREVALVATKMTDDKAVIGGARYVTRDVDGVRAAEVAFTVEEAYQGRGLAGRLLKHLIVIARDAGIERFEAEVLSENKPMLAVFERSGLPVKQSRTSGIVHVELELSTK